jgi:hypothetical protein
MDIAFCSPICRGSEELNVSAESMTYRNLERASISVILDRNELQIYGASYLGGVYFRVPDQHVLPPRLLDLLDVDHHLGDVCNILSDWGSPSSRSKSDRNDEATTRLLDRLKVDHHLQRSEVILLMKTKLKHITATLHKERCSRQICQVCLIFSICIPTCEPSPVLVLLMVHMLSLALTCTEEG